MNLDEQGKKKTFLLVGISTVVIILFIVGIVFFMKHNKNKNTKIDNKEITVENTIKVSNGDLETITVNGEKDYYILTKEKKIAISCKDNNEVTGCNKVIDLTNKNEYVHTIKVKNNGKTTTYNVYIKRKTNNNEKIIIIDKIDGIVNGYTNKNEEIIIGVKSENEIVGFSFDNGENYQNTNSYIVKENTTLYLKVKDKYGNESVTRKIKIKNIDRDKPTGSLVISSSSDDTVSIKVLGEDKTSGVSKYIYNNKEYKISELLKVNSTGKYSVIVVDKAGNKSDPIEITIKEDDFNRKENELVLSIDSNGSTVSNKVLKCKSKGNSCEVTLPSITRKGFNIIGFSKDKNAKKADYKVKEKITIKENTKLYAITSKQLSATIDGNNSTISGKNAVSCTIYNTDEECDIKLGKITANKNTPIIVGLNTSKTSTKNNGNYSIEDSTLTLNEKNNDKTWYIITKSNKKEYTLTLDSNGAILKENKLKCEVNETYNGVKQGDCSIELPEITRTGGIALGYSKEKNSKKIDYKIKEKINLSEDLTLYGVSKKVLNATLNENNSYINGDKNISCEIYNEEKTCLAIVPNLTTTNSESTILGLNVNSTDTINNELYSVKDKTLVLSEPNTGKTWYVISKTEGKSLRVEIDSNGANLNFNEVTCNTPTTYNGNIITNCEVTLPEISRNGGIVVGFSEDPNGVTNEYNSNQTISINNNRKLYAITYKTYYANFNGNGNSISEDLKICNAYNKNSSCIIDAPAITAPGSTPLIIGYSKEANSKTNDNEHYLPTNQITLSDSNNNKMWYAITSSTKSILSASFNANGATLSSNETKSCQVDEVYNGNSGALTCEVDAPEITREGYEIIGYSQDKDGLSNNSSYKNGKIVLTNDNNNSTWYAQTKKTLTAKFNENDNSLSSTSKLSCNIYNEQKSCEVSAPTIIAPTSTPVIIGYSTSSTNHVNNEAYDKTNGKLKLFTTNTNKTWYAQTKSEGKELTIVFDKNGADKIAKNQNWIDGTINYTGPVGEIYNGDIATDYIEVTTPEIQRTNGEIIGWSTHKKSHTKEYNVNEKIKLYENATLYAITKEDLNAKIDANGNTLEGETNLSCSLYNSDTSCNVQLGIITPKLNTTLVGLNLDKTTLENDSNYNIVSNTLKLNKTNTNKTWYVISKEGNKSFYLNIDENGASVENKLLSCETESESCTVTLPEITREGYQIMGYSTNEDAKTAEYSIGQTVTLTKNIKLYAITYKTLQATFDGNGLELSDDKNKTCNLYNEDNYCLVISPEVINEDGNIVVGYNLESTSNSSNEAYNNVTKTLILTNDNTNNIWYLIHAIAGDEVTLNIIGNGAEVRENTFRCINNCLITLPEITKEGATIVGYSKNKDLNSNEVEYNVGDEINLTKDMTLYAITYVTYKASFSENNSTLSFNNDVTCNAWNKQVSCKVSSPVITAPTSTPNVLGFNISSESTTKNSAHDLSKNTITLNSSNTNKTWYAITYANEKTLSAYFNGNGASLSGDTYKFCRTDKAYNGNLETLTCEVESPTITRDGYEIVGYSVNKDAIESDSEYNTGKIRLTNSKSGKTWYAITYKTITAKFSNSGAPLSSTADRTCKIYNKKVACEIDAPSVLLGDGKTLVGFNYVGQNTTISNEQYNLATNKILLYEEDNNKTWIAISYKELSIIFDKKDTTLSSNLTKTCKMYNNQVSCWVDAPETNVSSDYTFIGWNTDRNAHSNSARYKISSNKFSISNDENRKTVYLIKSKELSATFNKNGNTLDTNASTTQICDIYNLETSCTVTPPTILVGDNKEVIGWSLSSANHNNDSAYSNGVLTLTNNNTNKTWYAQTKSEGVKLKVHYILNGADSIKIGDTTYTNDYVDENACSTSTAYNGNTSSTKCTIKMPEINREGYTILGWSENSTYNSNNTVYQVNSNVGITKENYLYAQTYKNLTTKFNPNGNKFIENNQETTSTLTRSCTIHNKETSCEVKTPTIKAPSNTPTILGYNPYSNNYEQMTVGSYKDLQINETNYKWTWHAHTTASQKSNVTYFYGNGVHLSSNSERCTIPATYNGVYQPTYCEVDAPNYTLPENATFIGWSPNKDSHVNETYNSNTKKIKVTSSDDENYLIYKVKYTATFTNIPINAYTNTEFIGYSNNYKLSCEVYNNNNSCSIIIPEIYVHAKGYFIYGFDTGTATVQQYSKVSLNKDITIKPIINSSSKNKTINIKKEKLYMNKVYVEQSNNCSDELANQVFDTYTRMVSNAPYAFKASKVRLLGESEYVQQNGNDSAGLAFSSSGRIIEIRCKPSYASSKYLIHASIHEMAHIWDWYYGLRTGTALREQDYIKEKYQKYKDKSESERPLRDYSYKNEAEFFADLYTDYYFRYVDSNWYDIGSVHTGSIHAWIFNEDKFYENIEKYKNIAENGYKTN